MAEVQLFGAWASPFSCRIEIALKMKGVEYEYIKEDLSNKSPLLLEYNPVHKKVPVLVHKGKPIAESVVILEYIDETWKQNPILPNDPYERAMARFWAKFIDETFIDTLRKALWGEDKDREKFLNEACEHLKRLDNELKNKKFFGGDNVGLVDIVATLVGFWLGAFNEALGLESNLLTDDKFPNLCKLRDEYDNCNVIKDSLPLKTSYLTLCEFVMELQSEKSWKNVCEK